MIQPPSRSHHNRIAVLSPTHHPKTLIRETSALAGVQHPRSTWHYSLVNLYPTTSLANLQNDKGIRALKRGPGGRPPPRGKMIWGYQSHLFNVQVSVELLYYMTLEMRSNRFDFQGGGYKFTREYSEYHVPTPHQSILIGTHRHTGNLMMDDPPHDSIDGLRPLGNKWRREVEDTCPSQVTMHHSTVLVYLFSLYMYGYIHNRSTCRWF